MKKTSIKYHPVMKTTENIPHVDFSGGFDPSKLNNGWGIGGYNEKRDGMYTAPQYNNERNIHIGVDIWAPAGEEVYAPCDGVLLYRYNHNQEGNYGPVIVIRHHTGNDTLYALYGHLTVSSLDLHLPGENIKGGEIIGRLGDENENGGWVPHLHFQLSTQDPGEADMPGVVSESYREKALRLYPDPARLLGPLY